MRLAFIVSHPIQYYVPVYRELAGRIRKADERQLEVGGLRPETGDGLHGNQLIKDEETEGANVSSPKWESGKVETLSALKVFYTWRDAGPARDVRFEKTFAWDIPLMEGYDFEVVPNTSADPGTHHRKGLINPDLVERVKAWKPDAVHITGYNYVSHGQAIEGLSKAGIPVIFRGDSHLLDGRGPWWRWIIKKSWLAKVYSRPQAFAYVGQANRDYYRAFGVPERKLFLVPHTIEVGRFAKPNEELEAKALAWRRELGIPDEHFVFLYAAKLEPRKRPMELLEAFLAAKIERATLLFVGSGELEKALKEKAAEFSHGLTRIDTDGVRAAAPTGLGGNACAVGPTALAVGPPNKREDTPESHSRAKRDRQLEELSEAVKLTRIDADGVRAAAPTGLEGECSSPGTPGSRKAPSEKTDDGQLTTANSAHRVVFVPFQNQSAMPVVYRLGDALVLPSGYGETWGLAVNEAQACGRPALVSDCVGCARDIVREGENGTVFRTDDWEDCVAKMKQMISREWRSKRDAVRVGALDFDTACGLEPLSALLKKLERS